MGKKEQICNCLLNIYRRRASIFEELKKPKLGNEELEKIHSLSYRNQPHPLIEGNEERHSELLRILSAVCPKAENITAYKYLLAYFDVFSNGVESEPHLKWLTRQIKADQAYKSTFYRLLSIFVSCAMERYRFRACLKMIELFDEHLSFSMPFALKMKGGICCLWLSRFDEAMHAFDDLIQRPQETGYGSLYMLFCDAFIAKGRLREAQVLMNRIERIAHFDEPRIWMRFGDCLALQRKYDDAMKKYVKVIESKPSEEILQSAHFKLLQI